MMEMQTLAQTTLTQLHASYLAGKRNPVQVLQAMWQQIERINPQLNALYDLQREASLKAAQDADMRFRHSSSLGLLDGVPVTIKDSIPALGMRWHHGSKIHGAGIMGTADAVPVQRLKAAGAVILGKTTMPDFGLSASGVSSLHGMVRNPWGGQWSTGGSSAGAGASLAAGMGWLSVGTDIAGSVRLPACHCGLAAIKPTQGTIAYVRAPVRAPGTPGSAGPLVRHAADLEPALRALAGVHEHDMQSVPLLETEGHFADATVAVYRDFGFGPPVEEVVRHALEQVQEVLARLVAHVVPGAGGYDFDAYLPMDDAFKLRAWDEIMGAASELRCHAPKALQDWCQEAQHWDAQRLGQIAADIAKGNAQTAGLFGTADFLLTPVMPVVNFPYDALGPNPAMPLRHCTFTAPFNQSGHPAVALPTACDARGLPIGVQLVGKRFDDVRLCRLAAALEAQLWPDARQWPVGRVISYFPRA